MSYRAIQKGDRISEYALLEKLGQGGFGEVWKAEHAQLPGKFVAIKIPTSVEAMDCLKQEAQFQHELDHPNIVKTIGLNTQNDPPYFIMEYVEGKNLRQLMLDDGILPPPYAIDIAVQVCEALAFAHGKGIVHKDIKPENILVEKKKVDISKKGKAVLHYVKLTDLGLGTFPARHTLPAVDAPEAGSSHDSEVEPHSVVAAQRQRPNLSAAFTRPHLVVPGQSMSLSQRTPSSMGSSAGQLTLQLAFDGMIRSAFRSPFTSATMGFSYQVHEVWNCENSTSPVVPS